MSPDEQAAETDGGRRRFLAAGVKGGLVVGTLAWTTPAVVTAQTEAPVGSPPPETPGGGGQNGGAPANGGPETGAAPTPAPEVEPIEIPRSSPAPSDGPPLPTRPGVVAPGAQPPGEVPRVLADGQRRAPSVGDVLATTGADIARLAALGAGATAAGASVVGLTRGRSTPPADAVEADDGVARSPDPPDADEPE